MNTASGSGNRAGCRPARYPRRWAITRGSGRRRVHQLRSDSALV